MENWAASWLLGRKSWLQRMFPSGRGSRNRKLQRLQICSVVTNSHKTARCSFHNRNSLNRKPINPWIRLLSVFTCKVLSVWMCECVEILIPCVFGARNRKQQRLLQTIECVYLQSTAYSSEDLFENSQESAHCQIGHTKWPYNWSNTSCIRLCVLQVCGGYDS